MNYRTDSNVSKPIPAHMIVEVCEGCSRLVECLGYKLVTPNRLFEEMIEEELMRMDIEAAEYSIVYELPQGCLATAESIETVWYGNE